MIKYTLFGALAVGLVACGAGAVPADGLAKSEAALRSAQELGAEKNPQAALHLRLAQEQLAQGKALIKDGDNKRAEYVLGRAEADAEVAMNLARETTAKAEAQQTIENVQKAKQAANVQQQGANVQQGAK